MILIVQDNGVDIATEHLDRLFEKSVRVTSPLGREVYGTGLGPPCHALLWRATAGGSWAESELGKGTSIYFTLPRDGSCSAEED